MNSNKKNTTKKPKIVLSEAINFWLKQVESYNDIVTGTPTQIACRMCEFFKWAQLEFTMSTTKIDYIYHAAVVTSKDAVYKEGSNKNKIIVGQSRGNWKTSHDARDNACSDWLRKVYINLGIPEKHYKHLVEQIKK